MDSSFDVVIVGGGIIGMALALRAKELGLEVAVVERDKKPIGGSIRNFGMIWPIGQPTGVMRNRAVRSRDTWMKLAPMAGIWIKNCGSMHVAHADDEKIVLQEFQSISASHGFKYQWLNRDEALELCGSLNAVNLVGALFSQDECVVDPPQAIDALKTYLAANGVYFFNGLPAIRAKSGEIELSNGTTLASGRTIIASGTDLNTLYPNEISQLGIRVTKLQMLKTKPQPPQYSFGPHLAFGLTLLHYSGFNDCPSLGKLKKRLEADYSEFIKYGIHVMASQNQRGELVLGDSHLYDDDITPFDSSIIENLIMDYLLARLHVQDVNLIARWHGMYAKHISQELVCKEIDKNVWTALAPGGCGMTMCHGWAQDLWCSWNNVS